MRYKELLKPEYFEAFKNYEEKNRKILKEFGIAALRYHELMMIAECDPKGKTDLQKADEARCLWPEGFSFKDTVLSLRSKCPDRWMYNVDPALLTADEAVILVMYPFCCRMGGSFEDRFAQSGELYEWLCVLKEKAEAEFAEKRRAACCFTGHRPHLFPWGEDMTDPRAVALIAALDEAIEEAIADGITEFICGGALGVDTWAATRVLRAKGRHPHIRLILARPWEGHNSTVTNPDYLWVKQSADQRLVISQKEGKEAFLERDRWMVEHSSRIIAVYDEASGLKGGTFYTLTYAKEQGLWVKQIKWTQL